MEQLPRPHWSRAKPHPCLAAEDGILRGFAGNQDEARSAYAAYVEAGIGGEPPDVYQPIFGDEKFIESRQKLLDEVRDEFEYPLRHRLVSRPKLNAILAANVKWDRESLEKRNRSIVLAVCEFGYSQKEISEYLGLHYAHISRIISGQKMLKYKM